MATLDYLLQAYRLKDEPRAGWVLRGVRGGESVADHSWGTALLCLLFADEAGVPRDEALEIALVHDLAEAETGDAPSLADEAARPVPAHEKARREARAMTRLTSSWPGPASRRALARWQAYEARSDEVALFVRDMNLLDMCLQALVYEREGRYGPDGAAGTAAPEGRLDEFFASADARLSTALGRSLFAEVQDAYRHARARGSGRTEGGEGPGMREAEDPSAS